MLEPLGGGEAWERFQARESLRLAPASLDLRTRSLRRFFEYCRQENLVTILEEDMARYLAWVSQRMKPARGRSEPTPATLRVELSAIRIWLRYLYDEGLVLEPSYLFVPSLKGGRGIRKPLTGAEIEAWFSLCDLGCPLGLRDRALLELAYGSGLRRGELLGLELVHVDLSSKTLLVARAKNKQARVTPMTSRAAGFLALYLEKGRPRLATMGIERVFLTRRGAGMTLHTVKHRMAVYARHLTFGERVGLHLLRHSFATHLVRGGADVRHVSEMLGHRRLDSTVVYTEVAARDLEALRKCHPRGFSS